MPALRDVYLARQGEADPRTGALTPAGRRQADLLGARLERVRPDLLWHGLAPRTEQTSALVGARLGGVALRAAPEAGDHVPSAPTRDALPPVHAQGILDFVERVPAEERAAVRARRARELFTGPARGDRPRREVVIAHAFLVAPPVAHAWDAPTWRWVSTPVADTALTVIRYRPDAAAAVLVLNDTSHLPLDLHWTGFPPDLYP
ncbi:histidine phosphatase family protein [Nocardiopsis sp. MG754419]|uniref:histidine phosphatase family protein n=1 Tax=Nocardiopsis sp. MG754419 TaxID=2259865 RepID=UPI001BAD0334|nr:histidine phosphatase family protein [Nocardiopsis sp. MG754419]MBR8745271.1 histidine phosphatase family protein [Nocardiopsis sp. MG754419]